MKHHRLSKRKIFHFLNHFWWSWTYNLQIDSCTVVIKSTHSFIFLLNFRWPKHKNKNKKMKRLLPNDLENSDDYQHALKRGNKTSFNSLNIFITPAEHVHRPWKVIIWKLTPSSLFFQLPWSNETQPRMATSCWTLAALDGTRLLIL